MKFYNQILIAVMVFQPFSSVCMDKTSLPKLRSSELLLLSSVCTDRAKIYTDRLSEILLSEIHTRIVEIQSDSGLNKKIRHKRLNIDNEGFLQSASPETFQEFFLTIPENIQKHFLPTHFIAQNEKKIAQSLAKKKEEPTAQMVLVNDALEKEAAVNALIEENNALKKKADEKEKLLLAQKEKLTRRKKEEEKNDQKLKKDISACTLITHFIHKNKLPYVRLCKDAELTEVKSILFKHLSKVYFKKNLSTTEMLVRDCIQGKAPYVGGCIPETDFSYFFIKETEQLFVIAINFEQAKELLGIK